MVGSPIGLVCARDMPELRGVLALARPKGSSPHGMGQSLVRILDIFLLTPELRQLFFLGLP